MNTAFLCLGLLFTSSAAAALSWSDGFYGNDAFRTGLVVGLQVAVAAGAFLILIALLGCWSMCKMSQCGLTVFVCTLGLAILLWLVIVAFNAVNDTSVVAALFTAANYTYGPLLGLFGVGMFTALRPHAPWIPWACVLAPVAGYGLEQVLTACVGFSFGFALLPVNGLLTACGLWFISERT